MANQTSSSGTTTSSSSSNSSSTTNSLQSTNTNKTSTSSTTMNNTNSNNAANNSSSGNNATTSSNNNNNNTNATSSATSNVQQQQAQQVTSLNLPTILLTTTAQSLLANTTQQLQQQQHPALVQNTNAILDAVLCKLITPYHIINDPRLLDCGHSACLSCIIASKDADKNLKCVYCSNIHKIPIDTNKLTVNKNLQTFIKYNFKQNLLKQVEDSMYTLEEKFQTQNSSVENLDQYLSLVENDVQIKIENMKNNLEKIGEQFVQNIRTIKKELQKKLVTSCKDYESKINIYRQFIENKDSFGLRCDNNDNINQYHIMYPFTTNNDKQQQQQQQPQIQQQQQQQHHHPQQQQQQQHLQHLQQNIHHLSHHQQQPQQQQHQQQQQQRNTASTNHHLTNNAFSTTLLNTTANTVTATNLCNNTSNNTKSALLTNNNDTNTNLNSLNASLNGSQANNFQSFSNSSSFHEDLDELEAELNVKPTNTQTQQKRHLNKEQAQFNKFVREEVTKRFGENFLLQHEVNQLESSIMDLIKNEAISSFLPKNTAPARAWTLAKVSLRSLKRDLRRKQNQLFKKQECQKLVTHNHYFDSPLN